MASDLQLSLFESQETSLHSYHYCLSRLDLPGTTAALRQVHRTHSASRDVEAKLTAIVHLQAEIARLAASDLDEYSTLPLRLDHDSLYAPLAPDAQLLRQGLTADLARRLSTDSVEYLPSGLHAAEVLLQAGLEQAALACAQHALAARGEDSLLQQVLACLWFRRRREELGLLHLAYALYNDPRTCKVGLLAHRPAEQTLCRLLATASDLPAAWLELPLVLWEEHQLPVPADDPAFYHHLESRIGNQPAGASGDPHDSRLAFVRALYCAEVLRREQRDHERMVSLRARMKDLCPDWFARYMTGIGRR